MKYSREHTENGHSEYQDAIADKFEENGIILQLIEDPFGGHITVIAKESLAASHLHGPEDCHNFEKIHSEMNDFLGRAHLYFFGTEFDGPIESE